MRAEKIAGAMEVVVLMKVAEITKAAGMMKVEEVMEKEEQIKMDFQKIRPSRLGGGSIPPIYLLHIPRMLFLLKIERSRYVYMVHIAKSDGGFWESR